MGRDGETSRSADIGIVGLGVMGRNLALNLADHGCRVALYDPWPEARAAFAAAPEADNPALLPAESPTDFVACLARPRRILLMVKAGKPVDRQIAELAPRLEAGDLIVDAGNAHYRDSERRGARLAARQLQFLGLGVSGGAAGARRGPCLMAGGAPAAYALVEATMRRIAAQVDGAPCCALLGGNGAGHFVKMVHNGTEYAAMQLIAECYHLMRELLGLEAAEIGAVFGRWNETALRSYLLGITAEILAVRDRASGGPLVEAVLDTAGQKGTGLWAATEALELGVPAPTLIEAVQARALSMLKDERVAAARVLAGPSGGRPPPTEAFEADLEEALQVAMVCVYAQGFAVMAAGGRAHGWELDLGRVAAIWRGGSILEAALLESVVAAFAEDPAFANLLLAPAFAGPLAASQDAWRRVCAGAAVHGVPAAALASTLAYYDAYRSARLPANLIQAQRDYFGAHGFERHDRPGSFHGDWGGGDGEGAR